MRADKVLYTSAEVRKTIIEIFSKSKGRRVAIAAFVGSGAEAYLPKPEGIELICWPKAGGTNPDALRKLIKRGIKVSFADALHMKIYWTEDKGAVITSANLSTNALGSGNLREIGMLLPSNAVNIDRILKNIEPRRASQRELSQLDIAHQKFQLDNKSIRSNSEVRSFVKWYEMPFRPQWKLGYCSFEGNFSTKSKEISREEYKVSIPEYLIQSAKGDYKDGDWILSFFVSRNNPTLVHWIYVDYIAQTARNDKAYNKDSPMQAIQVWPDNRYADRPFKIDKRFRNALRASIKEVGLTKFEENAPVKPTKRLIELLQGNY